MSRSLEIARLEAQIARDWEAYQQRPRRRFIGARTQEFRFARYIEDWRAKVERVGELNYPQAARDQKIYGSLVVTVSIKSDGSLERRRDQPVVGHQDTRRRRRCASSGSPRRTRRSRRTSPRTPTS